MIDHQKISELIEEAKDLHSLFEELIGCVGGISESQCRNLLEQVNAKIKQLKKTDRELIAITQRSIHSEKLAAMGQMAAAISHELKNPLSGIKIAVEYLMRKLENQPEVMDIINNINNEVVFANNIISNILEHARISKPDFKKASIKGLIEEAILTVAQQGSFNNIKIKRDLEGDLPLLEIDIIQIRQVFMNLFINSAEAMIGGGILEIKAWQEKAMFVVEVKDTGVGIDEARIEKIFEPFFTTKLKGTGLGLAISKEIIEKHDGQIDVTSKVGTGTTFIIRLPFKRTTAPEIE